MFDTELMQVLRRHRIGLQRSILKRPTIAPPEEILISFSLETLTKTYNEATREADNERGLIMVKNNRDCHGSSFALLFVAQFVVLCCTLFFTTQLHRSLFPFNIHDDHLKVLITIVVLATSFQ